MKILIVDDEVIIRNGLCTVIDWKELGLTLIEAADSAEEALERVVAEKPHIVLTDIRMPGMDGIELAQEIKRLQPDTEIVILTGYDDFAYAQKALREGVTDYLLKTSGPEEIIKAAMKAKQRIIEKWEASRQGTVQSAALRSQLLERVMIQGGPNLPPLEPLTEWFQCRGLQAEGGGVSPMAAVLIAAYGWGEDHFARLLLGAAENMLSELLPCVALLKADKLIVLVPGEAGGPAEQGELERALEKVRQTLKCEVFAAAGPAVSSYADLHVSYREAERVFSYRTLLPAGKVYKSADIRERTGGRTVCSQQDESELSAILVGNNPTQLRHWVTQQVRAQLDDKAVTPKSIHAYLQSVVIAGHRWLERARGDQSMEHAPPAPAFDTEGRLEDEAFKQLSSIMATFHETMSGNSYSYIHKAIAYIRDHLDRNVTLQQVAKFVHLHPNHLSEVFRKETGQSYIEFVTQERMRRAADILRTSPKKISEVAGEVGYQDIKYFSQQFKKYTGQTPSEFRQHGVIGN